MHALRQVFRQQVLGQQVFKRGANRWFCALLVLLGCAWPLPQQGPRTASGEVPGEAPQAGLRAPFAALEPASRLGAPFQLERRAGWVPSPGATPSVRVGWVGARVFAPTATAQRPSLVAWQQLKLEGG